MGRYGHPYTDHFASHVVGTKLVFLFFPRKCYLTQKILWLKEVYQQTAMWTGPGDPVLEYRYYDKDEFLVNRIKGLG